MAREIECGINGRVITLFHNTMDTTDRDSEDVLIFTHEVLNTIDEHVRIWFVDTYLELYRRLQGIDNRGEIEEMFNFETIPDHKFIMTLRSNIYGPLAIIIYSNIEGYTDNIYMSQLVVHKDFQRRGLGTMIMKEFMTQNMDSSIYLLVRKTNKPAMEFYESLGALHWPIYENSQTNGISPRWPSEFLKPEDKYYVGLKFEKHNKRSKPISCTLAGNNYREHVVHLRNFDACFKPYFGVKHPIQRVHIRHLFSNFAKNSRFISYKVL